MEDEMNALCRTGGEAQADSSRGHKEQGRNRSEVSTEDSRYGGIDGKTQGQAMISSGVAVSSAVTTKTCVYWFVYRAIMSG